MTHAQAVAAAFRRTGVELTPVCADQIGELLLTIAGIAGQPVSIMFSDLALVTANHRTESLVFSKLED